MARSIVFQSYSDDGCASVKGLSSQMLLSAVNKILCLEDYDLLSILNERGDKSHKNCEKR